MAELKKKTNLFEMQDIFPEDTTEFDNIDEFNLTSPQALGEVEEIPDSKLDKTVSVNEFTTYTGTAEGFMLNDEAFEQIERVVKEAEHPVEDIIEEANIEVKREFTDEEKERLEKGRQAIIEGKKIIKECFDDAIQTEINTGLNAKKVREYKNEATYQKSKFSKAKDGEDSTKKYFFMIVACIALGIFGGVYANSYYVLQGMKPTMNAMNCAFGWLTMFDSMPISMSPFNAGIFFGSGGIWAGILGVIILFSALNKSQMKTSRVGHEHGNAKLMNGSSFKKYKNRFMEG